MAASPFRACMEKMKLRHLEEFTPRPSHLPPPPGTTPPLHQELRGPGPWRPSGLRCGPVPLLWACPPIRAAQLVMGDACPGG